MPDEAEFPEVSPYAEGFQKWLIDYTAFLEKEGPNVVDVTIIIMNCLAKLRGVLTADEVHAAMHNALHFLEGHLAGSGAILAEQWRDKEDGFELYKEASIGRAPDDISELTEGPSDQLPSDFDLRD